MPTSTVADRVVPGVDRLIAAGRAGGLSAVGVAPALRFDRARSLLEARKAAGLHGGMQFTYKNPARSTDPSGVLRTARAIVAGAFDYGAGDPPAPPGPHLRIARYARNDPYRGLGRGLEAIGAVLRDAGWAARVMADDNSVVDREAAWLAGIGWYGANANLLLPGVGSWFVLGAVVTDAPLDVSGAPMADGCGPCRRCLDHCPTGAIVAPGVVDAGRCLAWLLQAPGVFPHEHRAALGDRLYGCDDCQEACPPNRRRRLPASATDDTWASLVWVLRATDAELLERFGRWYIPGRDLDTVRRNALVALGNIGDGADPEVASSLARALAHPNPLLRAHAVWAARRLGRDDLAAACRDDVHPMVRAELAAPARPGKG